MAEILLFHHALGLTTGVEEFADALRSAGHTVHTPDLYEGRTFATIDEGVAHAQATGFGTIVERGVAAAAALPKSLVYMGQSLGVLPAQKLAQARPGARAAVFFYSCMQPSDLGGTWPAALPLQVHMRDADPWAADDLPAARALVDSIPDGTLYLYPGTTHLFTERGFVDYHGADTELALQRVHDLLARVG